MDANGDERVELAEFVSVLSRLSPEAPAEAKTEFLFAVYDLNGDGYIDADELRRVVASALADNADVAMSEAQVDELVAATMRLADLDGDGKISLHEFRELVRNRPSMLDDFMTVRVGGLVAGAGATAGAAAGHTT